MCRSPLPIALALTFFFACGFKAAPAEADPGTSPRKIVFIAGPKDHGSPGAHEYEKDLLLLKKNLDESAEIKGIVTKIYVGRVPEDMAELGDAATIVLHSSGDGRADETHALFPQNNANAPEQTYCEADVRRLEAFDALMKKGVGIVVLHYSLIVAHPRSQEYFTDWIGGYHRPGFSKVKIDRSEAVPATPGHPILRGVRPWTTDHEYYFNQYFLPKDPRFVPILTSMLPSDQPQKHVVAWAVEREGGGRGFALTGCHYHANMLIDDYRQMLRNAILWTAKVPMPEATRRRAGFGGP